jgi:ABC-2 type transport system permease protein
MSEILVIIQREFVERVRSRSFLISTILMPLFIIGSYAIPAMMGSGGGSRRIAVVDESGQRVGDAVVASLTAPRQDPDAPTYLVERVAAPFSAAHADLTRRVQMEKLDGYVWIPADVMQKGEVTYRARSIANFAVNSDLKRAVSGAVQAMRMKQAGLEGARVAALTAEVKLKTGRITNAGEQGGSAAASFVFAYLASFLMYFMLIFYGMNVMRSVLEEKSNRISEVLVSSVRADRLMLGKIAGVGAVALFQIFIWIVTMGYLASHTSLVTQRLHVSPEAISSMSVEPTLLLGLLAFFLLGFFLYSAVYAAVGAAMGSEQEAQQFQIFVLLPLMAPMLVFGRLAAEPMGTLATVMGLIPFTAPITNAIRMSATPVPPLQIAASMVGMLVAVFVVAWIAGKIYRVGILSTGKKPTLPELVRWLRAA